MIEEAVEEIAAIVIVNQEGIRNRPIYEKPQVSDVTCGFLMQVNRIIKFF